MERKRGSFPELQSGLPARGCCEHGLRAARLAQTSHPEAMGSWAKKPCKLIAAGGGRLAWQGDRKNGISDSAARAKVLRQGGARTEKLRERHAGSRKVREEQGERRPRKEQGQAAQGLGKSVVYTSGAMGNQHLVSSRKDSVAKLAKSSQTTVRGTDQKEQRA